MTDAIRLNPVATVRSPLKRLGDAPRQGSEGAPGAVVELHPEYATAARDLAAGDEVFLLTWLHLGDRAVQETHPRNDPASPLTGVFATRSPDRPNPIGLHRVRIERIEGLRVHVAPLEALDGTPVLDIKPVLPDDGR